MTSELSIIAILAAAAACWQHIRAFISRLGALLFTQAQINGPASHAVTAYLFTHGKVLNWGERRFMSHSSFVRPLQRVVDVIWETTPLQPLFIWIDGMPVFVSTPSHPGAPGSAVDNSMIVITGIRGWFDVKRLTLSALNYAIKMQTTGKRYFVRRIGGQRAIRAHESPMSTNPLASHPAMPSPEMRFLHWKSEDIGARRPANPFGSYAMNTTTETILNQFQRWLGLKEWYQAKGIPWRRGFLFKGAPGTGKTSLARSLAQEADMPVFVYDISTLFNEEFAREWQSMQEHAPCMALIEDIDGCFEGRTNLQAQSGGGHGFLTFDCLLNCLDGVQSAEGVVTVITTNRPETLDPALIRPGRIDSDFEIPMPDDAQRRSILTRILDEATEQDMADTVGMSAAAVTKYATDRALAKVHGEP